MTAREDTCERMVAEMDKIGDDLKHSYSHFKLQF